ncbi:MAG: hypothetical protein Q8P51_10020 [Ignavibacteria bacterium]|nr:hypothetical protein [Ignavibacteria bacterium]
MQTVQKHENNDTPIDEGFSAGKEAAADKKIGLLFEGERRFVKFHFSPYKKKPTEFRVQSRGAAGMLVSI